MAINTIDSKVTLADYPLIVPTKDIILINTISYLEEELKKENLIYNSKTAQLIKNFLFVYKNLKNISKEANSWKASLGLNLGKIWYKLIGLTSDIAQKKAEFISTIQEFIPRLKPIEEFLENFFITLEENKDNLVKIENIAEKAKDKLLFSNGINLNYFIALLANKKPNKKTINEPIANQDFKNIINFIAENFKLITPIINNFQEDFKNENSADLLKVLLTGKESTNNLNLIFELITVNLEDPEKKETLQLILKKLELSLVANHIEFIKDNIEPLKKIANSFQTDLILNKDNSEIKNFLMGPGADRNFRLLIELIIHNTENINNTNNEKKDQLIAFLKDLKLDFIVDNLEILNKLAVNFKNDLDRNEEILSDDENFEKDKNLNKITYIKKILTGGYFEENLGLLLDLIINNVSDDTSKNKLKLALETYIKDKKLLEILDDLIDTAERKEESIFLNLSRIIPYIDNIIASKDLETSQATKNKSRKNKTIKTYLVNLKGFGKIDNKFEINGNREDLITTIANLLGEDKILDVFSKEIEKLTPKIFQPTSFELQKTNEELLEKITNLKITNHNLDSDNKAYVENFNQIQIFNTQIEKNNHKIEEIRKDENNLENNYFLKIFKDLLIPNSDDIKKLFAQIGQFIESVNKNITIDIAAKDRLHKILSKENTEQLIKIFEITTSIFKDSKFSGDSFFKDEIVQNIIGIFSELFTPTNEDLKSQLIKIISSDKKIGVWEGLNIFELIVLVTTNPVINNHISRIYESINKQLRKDKERDELMELILNSSILYRNQEITLESFFTDYFTLRNNKLKESLYEICDIFNLEKNKLFRVTLQKEIEDYNTQEKKLEILDFLEKYIFPSLKNLGCENIINEIKKNLERKEPVNPQSRESYRKIQENKACLKKSFNVKWNTREQQMRNLAIAICLILLFCTLSSPILFIKKPSLAILNVNIGNKENIIITFLITAIILVLVATVLILRNYKTIEEVIEISGEAFTLNYTAEKNNKFLTQANAIQ